MGTGSLKAALTDGSAISLLTSTTYVTSFLEYLVFFSAIVILSFLLIGVGWVLGPGFIVVSSGAFMGYVYDRAVVQDVVDSPRSESN